MRLFFNSVELTVSRENVASLREKLPQDPEILKAFDSAQKGRQKRPVLIGHAKNLGWRVQGFEKKVVVTCRLTSKMGMDRGQVVALGTSLALPPGITFRPVVDRHSDPRGQAIIDANVETGELWDKGLDQSS